MSHTITVRQHAYVPAERVFQGTDSFCSTNCINDLKTIYSGRRPCRPARAAIAIVLVFGQPSGTPASRAAALQSSGEAITLVAAPSTGFGGRRRSASRNAATGRPQADSGCVPSRPMGRGLLPAQ
jgi:hypothetical protein